MAFAAHPGEPTRARGRAGYNLDRAKWQDVKYKAWQWMQLKVDIEPKVFDQNTVVCLVDVGPVNTTPTKRPGQSNQWKKKEFDTLYRFAKLHCEETTKLYASKDLDGAIAHAHLARTPDGEPDVSPYNEGDVVYLLPNSKTRSTKTYHVVLPSGLQLEVPAGACGIIKRKTTTRSGEAGVTDSKRQGSSTGRKLPYIVWFPVKAKTYQWVVCNQGLLHDNFTPLSDANSAKKENDVRFIQNPPDPKVVKCQPHELRTFEAVAPRDRLR